MQLFKPIEKELNTVTEVLNREYNIKAGHLSTFAHIELSPEDTYLRPGIVILTGKSFNCNNEKLIYLAAIVQFIYLASNIHTNVSDEDDKYSPGKDPRDGSQFPVLVGDYLYGKFFTTLCNAGIVKYLKPLSEVICSIHEAAVMKEKYLNSAHKDIAELKKLIYMEISFLFETGCRLAADLIESGSKSKEIASKIGKEFGIAFGMYQYNLNSDLINYHIKKAEAFLNQLQDNLYTRQMAFILRQFGQNNLKMTCTEG